MLRRTFNKFMMSGMRGILDEILRCAQGEGKRGAGDRR
jgi:hypothetical protein